MSEPSLEQLVADSDVVVREWETFQQDDPVAVHEHLAKLRMLAVYLNAHLGKHALPISAVRGDRSKSSSPTSARATTAYIRILLVSTCLQRFSREY
jgi:hypothetical protein